MNIAFLVYLLYLVIFALLNLIIIYHVRKYRYPKDASGIAIAIYSCVIITIIAVTLISIGLK